ncbi:MAG: hypothetical protein WCY19_06040 [Candidatus Gastranaerophilaceae bacterium]
MRTDKISFGDYTKLWTKDPKILNALDDLECHVLSKKSSPLCRYNTIAQSGDTWGRFWGILADGEDAKKGTPLVFLEGINEVFIAKLEELKQIPALEKYYSYIKTYYDGKNIV